MRASLLRGEFSLCNHNQNLISGTEPALLVGPAPPPGVATPSLMCLCILVQECSGGTLFSEIISIKKTLFSDMFGTEQPFSLRNNNSSGYCYIISKHLFSLISRCIEKYPFFWILCPWIF